MGGLLEALSGGVAAAGKTASETLLEQAKQAALSLREENLVRITNLYAKEREKGAQEFTRGENKLTRETTVSESKLTRDQAKELAEKQGSRELLLHGQTISSQEKIAEEATARAMALQTSAQKGAETLQASGIAGQKELQVSALAGAKINAEALVRLTHSLKETERGVIDKTITDLSKYLPKDQAIAVTLAGLTKEQTELERTQLKSWVDMYISDTKVEGVGGTLTQQQKDKIAEGVTARLHYDPSAIVARSLALTTGKPVIAPAPKNSFDEIAAKLSGKTPVTAPTAVQDKPPLGAVKPKLFDAMIGDFIDRFKELKSQKGLLQ